MVPLDSPRWSSLSTAYGTAEDIPDLIRAIAAEKHPRGENPDESAWRGVFGLLVHQYTTYSSTVAAFPHIVAIANDGTVGQRAETLMLAGLICVKTGVSPDLPEDLLVDFQPALDDIRRWSLRTVREVELSEYTPLPYLLQAFGGLRYADSELVFHLDFFRDGIWEVELECEACNQRYPADDDLSAPKSLFAIQMTPDGPVSEPWYGSDMPVEGNAVQLPVNREAHSRRLKEGAEILQRSDDPAWKPAETSNVLAALALERGEADFATRILDFQSTIGCPRCRSRIDLGAYYY